MAHPYKKSTYILIIELNMKVFFRLAILVLLLFTLSDPASAQVPRFFSYQGQMRQQNGGPVKGKHTLFVQLVDGTGIANYAESDTVTFSDDGIFNIRVGGLSGLPASVDFSRRWSIAISLDGDSNVVSVQELASVPSAMVAAAVVDRAITSSKLAAASVGASTLNAAGSTGFLFSDGSALSWQSLGSSGASGYPVQGSIVPFTDENPKPGYSFMGTTDSIGGTWTRLNPQGMMPFFSSATAQVGNTIYVFGQSNGDPTSYVPDVRKISLPSGALTHGTNLPGALGASAAAAWKNTIYVFGGSGFPQGTSGIVPTVYAYNTTNDSVRTLNHTGWTGRAYATAVTVGDSIWVIGGIAVDGRDVKTIDIFNPKTEVWSKAPDSLQFALEGSYAGTDGKFIYVLGGTNRTSGLNGVVQAIDVKTGAVSTLSNGVPAPSAFGASVTLGNKIYMFGGTSSHNLDRMLIFDMLTRSFSIGPSFFSARQIISAGAYGNRFYLFGGYDGASGLSATESYTLPFAISWFVKN